MKKALITGVVGQDGAYLANYLRSCGYSVIGTTAHGPRDSAFVGAYLAHVDLRLIDITDRAAMRALLETERPDEIYNLASISSVARSWARPVEVTQVNGVAVLGLLQELRDLKDRTEYAPRLCQASSAEIYGSPDRLPQREDDPIAPTNPYAVAKALAHESVRNYRAAYGLTACSVILFNHESPLRSAAFVTRKITSAAVEIAAGRRDSMQLGRLDVRRDWGFAGDYVRAMQAALQAPDLQDVIVATGESRSLEEFVSVALTAAGVKDGDGLVTSDPSLVRPTDVLEMRGDPTRAESHLGWHREASFEQLVAGMIDVDRRRLDTGVEHDAGYLLLPTGVR